MTHATDEQLAACALRDFGDMPEAAAVQRHIDACERCRAELDAIRSMLGSAAALEVPARGEDYGARVWAALEPRLPARPASRAGWRPPRAWLAAAAVLVLAVGAFIAGRWSGTGDRTAEHETRPLPAEAIHERVVLAALGDHLERTERTLIELVNQDASDRVDISAEQAWARDLLQANRLYRQTARSAASPALKGLLDDLEPVLLEIANSPARLSTAEYLALRNRIEDRSLVFKVRATGAGVRARERKLIREGVTQS